MKGAIGIMRSVEFPERRKLQLGGFEMIGNCVSLSKRFHRFLNFKIRQCTTIICDPTIEKGDLILSTRPASRPHSAPNCLTPSHSARSSSSHPGSYPSGTPARCPGHRYPRRGSSASPRAPPSSPRPRPLCPRRTSLPCLCP